MSIANWIEERPHELTALIVTQRWFGDKSRTIKGVTPRLLHEFAHDGHQFGLVAADFVFSEGDTATYFTPVVHRADDAYLDAMHEPGFLDWLAHGFDRGHTISASDGMSRITWQPVDSQSTTAWTSHPGRILEGEQSNTSVMYGSDAIVKVFRKMQAGVNPDTEIVAFLTERHGFQHVPPFLGSIILEREGEEHIELAAVQGFVPNQGDCWRWLPSALASANAPMLDALTDSIRFLGVRTGELHAALADSGGHRDFAPEPFSRTDRAALKERLRREVQVTTSMLHRHGACSDAESEALASSLLASVAQADVLEGSLQTRVHGDYHLGQVLRTDGDFVIIDFEGEPSRPMRERREKASPLKDVAGMLRSIDYAVATVMASGQQATARSESLGEWRQVASSAFLAGYRAIVNTSLHALIPTSEDRVGRALDLFMIEKALYEVRYELDNRPTWVGIPFGALQRIAAAG